MDPSAEEAARKAREDSERRKASFGTFFSTGSSRLEEQINSPAQVLEADENEIRRKALEDAAAKKRTRAEAAQVPDRTLP